MRVDPPPAPILKAATDLWSRADQKHWLPVAGSSMAPFLNMGDDVLVAHLAGSLRRGDVVVIYQAGHLLAHRVLVPARGNAQLPILTQGDHNPRPDLLASDSRLLGRVCAVRVRGRERSIETLRWRFVGRLIASSQLALDRLGLPSGPLPAPRRLAAAAGRRLLAAFRAINCP